MTYTIVAQGGTAEMVVTFYAFEGGPPVDDDRYDTTGQLPVPSTVTPTGGENPIVVGTPVRVQKGTYRLDVSAAINTTLTTALNGVTPGWQVKWDLRINGQPVSFLYDVIVVPSGSSAPGLPFYNDDVDALRISLGERYEGLPQQAYAVNATAKLSFDAVRMMEVTRNGGQLDYGVHYTFARPRTLKFLTSIDATDVVVARAAVHFEDRELDTLAREAKAQIDTYIAQLYALPLLEVPPILKEIERQIVRGRLILEFAPRPGVASGKDDTARGKQWLSAALRTLEQLANGDLPLVLANGDIVTPNATITEDDLFAGIQNDAAGDEG